MTIFFQFDHADVFTAGAVGRPGERTFFLQVRSEGQLVTIKCEKQQVAAMSEYLRGLLADLPTPTDTPSTDQMDMNIDDDHVFVLGPIGLAFDRDTERFVVQLEELLPESDFDDDLDDLPDDNLFDDVPEDDRSTVRALLSPGQVLAFCDRAESLVSAGRPPCIYCGNPMNPDGHPCPRMN